MTKFEVPARGDVSENNQTIFDTLEKQVGMVPNLYATMALSNNALGDYLAFSSRKSSLSKKEQEIVSLAVSTANACTYCQAAHTAIGKMNGFSDEEILGFRKGVSGDERHHALAQISKALVLHRGIIDEAVKNQFFDAGFTQENLVDVIFQVGDKTITNYLYGAFNFPIDFPLAPALQEEVSH